MAKKRKYLTIIWKSWQSSPIVNIWDTKTDAWENLVYYYQDALNNPEYDDGAEFDALHKEEGDGCGYVEYSDGHYVHLAVVSNVF